MKFWLQESRWSEQFLEDHKQPWNFESKGQKFYVIAFLTFRSQHFEREGFFFQSKHGNARELNL